MVIQTCNYQGESWEYREDFTRSETSKIGQGVFIQNMDFRIVSGDVASYVPSGYVSSGTYLQAGTNTLTLTEGDNTFTHNFGVRLKGLIVADSSDQEQYMPVWSNTDENEVNIEWVGADLTNAKLKYSY